MDNQSSYPTPKTRRELTEAKYCRFFKVQKSVEEDMECDKCSAFFRVLQEPNPYKCRDLIFLKWWTDEIQSSPTTAIKEEKR